MPSAEKFDVVLRFSPTEFSFFRRRARLRALDKLPDRRTLKSVQASDVRVLVEAPVDDEALRSATASAREAAVLELYRLGRISSGAAAGLLGIERVTFLELAASRRIATIQTTPEELDAEIGNSSR